MKSKKISQIQKTGNPEIDFMRGGEEASTGRRGTVFTLWAPTAEQVEVRIYPKGEGGEPSDIFSMRRWKAGIWKKNVGWLTKGKFYTFRIMQDGLWHKETPGILAKTTGINGERATLIDLKDTDPEGWESDCGPELKSRTDAVVYELHLRDFTAHESSGIINKGKFQGLAEKDTMIAGGEKTGLGHLKELGITHVQLMPCFDFDSLDESDTVGYNWGYDPVNYFVPEGTYSTDPYDPVKRIRDMKRMIKTLHEAGIGVIMDVVFNHTSRTADSNFTLTAPNYFYRFREDRSLSNGSGCGNETASEKVMMREFIKRCCRYWVTEYHVDGFRFDLMGLLDIETMRQTAETLKDLRPDILLYGEGWTAAATPLPPELRAEKMNIHKVEALGAFSDDIRDGIKGHFMCDSDRGFATGQNGLEETIKIGIVGATRHRQVDYRKGSKATEPYAISPAQTINYVSCHDDLMLTDKLRISMPESNDEKRKRAALLAQTIVLTSQGIPFIWCGEEFFRDRKGFRNTYNMPDSVNSINWNLKSEHRDQFEYYKELIKLRKEHPAFRMTTAEQVERHLVFDKVACDNLISYSLKDHANGDPCDEIKVIFNGSQQARELEVAEGDWIVVARDGKLKTDGLGVLKGGKITVPSCSALIMMKNPKSKNK